MCDLAYVNFLREKVRQREDEDRRIQAFGPSPSVRFVPWVMPAQAEDHHRSATVSAP
jgi:hypothetical protein